MTSTNSSNHEQIGYGMKDGKLTHISQVDSGLACNCICPACSSTLIARKGEINVHHFAHQDLNACSGVNETILHKLGKATIAKYMKVGTPAVNEEVSSPDLLGTIHKQSYNNQSYTLLLSDCQTEEAFEDFRPDITAIDKNGELIFIEIVVTNPVSHQKLTKVKKHQYPMMSIDLSNVDPLADLEEIEKAVLYSAARTWDYHPELDDIRNDLKSALDTEIEAINFRILSKTKQHFNLIEQQDQSMLPTPGFGEILVVGVTSVHGYSSNTQRNFDISLLHTLTPLDSRESENYRIRTQAGFEIKKESFDPRLIDRLKELKIPTVIRPIFARLSVGGRARDVIVDF